MERTFLDKVRQRSVQQRMVLLNVISLPVRESLSLGVPGSTRYVHFHVSPLFCAFFLGGEEGRQESNPDMVRKGHRSTLSDLAKKLHSRKRHQWASVCNQMKGLLWIKEASGL